MASFYEPDNWFVGRVSENGGGSLGDAGSFFAVPDPVNRCDQNSASIAAHQVMIARLALSRKNVLGDTIFDHRFRYGPNYSTITVVPLPSYEIISTSTLFLRPPG